MAEQGEQGFWGGVGAQGVGVPDLGLLALPGKSWSIWRSTSSKKEGTRLVGDDPLLEVF
jgi:hypothetical protein